MQVEPGLLPHLSMWGKKDSNSNSRSWPPLIMLTQMIRKWAWDTTSKVANRCACIKGKLVTSCLPRSLDLAMQVKLGMPRM